jgi:hypothetical protein
VKSSRRRGGVRVGTETGIAFHDGAANSIRRENVAGTHWGHKTRLWPCLFQFDGFDERGQRRTSRAHRGDGAAGCNLVFRPVGIAARLQSTTSGSRASLELSQTTNAPAGFRRCPI